MGFYALYRLLWRRALLVQVSFLGLGYSGSTVTGTDHLCTRFRNFSATRASTCFP